MPNVVVRKFSQFALLVLVATSVVSTTTAQDNFDGAVWKFEMSNKQDPSKMLIGQFRVSDHVLFQKDTPADPKYSKQIGTNHPDGKKTRFEVTDFRVFTKDKKRLITMKGTGRLTFSEFGEWHGLFTDGRGGNWRFKASRIKE